MEAFTSPPIAGSTGGIALAAPPIAEVVKRDGRTVAYDRSRIAHAIEMAFRAEARVPYPDAFDAHYYDDVDAVTDAVELVLTTHNHDVALAIETIQDEVERALMDKDHYAVARRYILYRQARAERRRGRRLRIREADGRESILESAVLRGLIVEAAQGLTPAVDPVAIADEALNASYDGVTRAEVSASAILAARARVERAPEYATLAARLLLADLYVEVIGHPVTYGEMRTLSRTQFARYIARGIEIGRLDTKLAAFDLTSIASAIDATRDLQWEFIGAQTLYDRYVLQHDGRRYELPQWFWMRVAMGLALGEVESERTARAIEFYDVLSSFAFCSSTPTLFNAGTIHPQLSSCFLTTVQDDLGDIFKAIRDNALLSKWSGGLGNDWTNVRGLGSLIKGTGGPSQGVIPFLKVANDTAIAVNQGGKRQGATCAYLETWHVDIEEFVELRKNTGDDRRRTHDMHLAHWIPDLSCSACARIRTGRCSVRAIRQTCTISTARRSAIGISRMKHWPTGARSSHRSASTRLVSGGRCSRWCSRRAIRGSPSRIRRTSAARRITPASCTARISARRFCSTRAATKSPSATSAR
jgi:ribonucleoside-diphosphate reductase alpha chain